MTLIDANLLLYATDEASPFHSAASGWLTRTLNGVDRVGIPWQSLGAFLRISTDRRHPRPRTPTEAWGQVHDWLAADTAWTPSPGPRHAETLGP